MINSIGVFHQNFIRCTNSQTDFTEQYMRKKSNKITCKVPDRISYKK